MATAVEVAAEPAGAAAFEGFESLLRILFQRETGAGLQVVEGQGSVVGVVVGIVVVQQTLNLLGDRMGEWDASGIFFEKDLKVGRKEVGMGDNHLAVFLLPLMTMRLDGMVFQVGLKMGRLVKEDPEKEIRV